MRAWKTHRRPNCRSRGVSPRTFHNYFSSASDALLFFAASLLESYSDVIENMYPEMGINEFFETMLLEVLDDDQPNLHSLATLVTIGESIESMSHTAEERQRFEKWLSESSRLSAAACQVIPNWN